MNVYFIIFCFQNYFHRHEQVDMVNMFNLYKIQEVDKEYVHFIKISMRLPE